MNSDELVFANDDLQEDIDLDDQPWKILVVDDEPEIHQITRLVLSGLELDGRPLSLLYAHSAKEAKQILQNDAHHDIAVAIVDVVMETHHAGLELVQWVRKALQNFAVRLVLRTGQPGEAPEEKVIKDYDINDYKNKTELTAMRLKTSIYSALRGYRDIRIIERHRHGLEKIITATTEFIECDTLPQFASTILQQISIVLNIQSSHIICCAVAREARKMKGLDILATNLTPNHPSGITPEVQQRIDEALKQKSNIHHQYYFIGYFTTRRGSENILYVAKEGPLEPIQHQLLDFFANNIAVAHENLKLREVIRDSQKELSYVIGEAVEMRSKETGSHVKRVANISYQLAMLYGLSNAEAEMIKLASPLHDVGKVGIPDHILNKPGKHDIEEQKVMRTHAKIGYDMLNKSNNPILKLGAEIAYQHHEKWDGTGYPRELKGNDIHIAGRISAVADVFDALGSKRCYKGPWPNEQIRVLFQQERGKSFEPALVDILLDNFELFCDVRKMYPDPY